MKTQKHQTFMKWQYGVSALIITAVMLLALSAPVRAKAIEFIRLVAGFNVQEQSESPINPQPETTTNSVAASQETSVPNIDQPVIVPVQTEQAAVLMQDLPFALNLPTWVPDGFTLNENTGLSTSESWVSLEWSNANQSEIELLVEKEYTGYNLPVGENSAEEITINGAPALLVRGFWGENHQWDNTRGLVIGWKLNNQFYRLTYSQREPLHNEIASINDIDSRLADLVKIAESIKATE